MNIPTTITLPEEIKAKGIEKASNDHKSFSEYLKDLIIDDLAK